jgi:hypothetical protein
MLILSLSLSLSLSPQFSVSKEKVYAILHLFFPSATPFSTILSVACARIRSAGVDEQDNGAHVSK